MCLIVINEKPGCGGVPKKTLELGATRNKDGAGIAWIDGDVVRWKKGITDFNEIFEIAENVPSPHLIHFRLSTIGGDNSQLTHPFPVTADCSVDLEGTAPAVISHNGIWSSWQQCVIALLNKDNILPSGPWSDTRGIAWTTFHHGEGLLDLIGEKVGLLTPQGITAYGKGWYRDNFNDLLLSNNPYESTMNGGYWVSENEEWEFKQNSQNNYSRVRHCGGYEYD